MKSIELAPKTITSAKFMDPDVFEKGGFKVPALCKWLMKLGIAKYKKKAKSVNVNLQAVGAFPDGKRLQHIVNDVAEYITPPPFDYLPISSVTQQTLNEKSIWKVLVMESSNSKNEKVQPSHHLYPLDLQRVDYRFNHYRNTSRRSTNLS